MSGLNHFFKERDKARGNKCAGSNSYAKNRNTQPASFVHKPIESDTYSGWVDAKLHERNGSKPPIRMKKCKTKNGYIVMKGRKM